MPQRPQPRHGSEDRSQEFEGAGQAGARETGVRLARTTANFLSSPGARHGVVIRLAVAIFCLLVSAWLVTGCRGRRVDIKRQPDQNVLLGHDRYAAGGRARRLRRAGAHAEQDGLAATGPASNSRTRTPRSRVRRMERPHRNIPVRTRGPRSQRLVKPGTRTIATLLKRQGFATGAFVGGVPLERRFGFDDGFDVYETASAAPATRPTSRWRSARPAKSSTPRSSGSAGNRGDGSPGCTFSIRTRPIRRRRRSTRSTRAAVLR